MHIRVLTKKAPAAASSGLTTVANVLLIILQIMSAGLGVVSQVNTLIVNIGEKTP
jgi:hypothetical protein